MSDRRARSKLIRHVVVLACVCSSLYYVPTLLDKLKPGQSPTETLLTQYLPAEVKARLEQIEASGGSVTTDRGLEVPQYHIEVRRRSAPDADQHQPEQDGHTAGDDASSITCTISGGS
jgi:hypothetical protein